MLSAKDTSRLSQAMRQDPETVTIASGAATSSQIDITDRYLLGVAVLVVGGATKSNTES